MSDDQFRVIVSRDDRDLLRMVEERHGREAADALAAAMTPSVEAEVDDLIARRNKLLDRHPERN
jgi:hypothetical protein